MILVVGLICAPLGYQRADRIREGQLRPRSYPLSPVLSEMIRERIEQVPGILLLSAGRSGVDYDAADIGIILYGSEPAPLSLKEDLVAIVKDFRGEDVSVEVTMLKAGKWVES